MADSPDERREGDATPEASDERSTPEGAAKETGSRKPAAKKTATKKAGHASRSHRSRIRLPTRAVVVESTEADKRALLASVMERVGFWAHLEAACHQAKVAPEAFRILIKPDFAVFHQGASTGTDPALVEHLIDLLHERGFSHIDVGEGRNDDDLWLENRDVLVLADLIGYRFVTQGGYDYDVIDLTEDIVEVGFPEGSVLHGTGLARPWAEAHYRICFAKNKTDEQYFYALSLQSLLGVLPKHDKAYHYHHRLDPGDVCVALLKQTPVHFGFIDALVSNHGGAGTRVVRPLITSCLIASENLLLADWAAASKMGLDPFASPINAAALRQIGLPDDYEIEGSLMPYLQWENVEPVMADSVRRRNHWTAMSRTLKPWLQSVDPTLFPFKDLVSGRLNARLSRYFADVDANPMVFWSMVGVNYLIGAVHEGLIAYRTQFNKDQLRWREVPLGLDLAAYTRSDYEATVAYLTPLAEFVRRIPADANGLRWCYLGGSVLFEFSRTIAAPFEDFVARVDVSRAIAFMNDYIGGVAVPIARDKAGRVTHQAERNLYLPQPNYMVLYQGKVIDVTKLEYCRYSDRAHQMFWKTIKSENDSASYDDGIVTFARTADGEVLATVFGRQEFTLPLLWQAIDMDLYPQVKDALVEHAYTTFFSHTMANFEAQYEGRTIRIGRPWDPFEGEPGAGTTPPTEVLSEILGKAREVVQNNWTSFSTLLPSTPRPNPLDAGEVDEDGFRHFKAEADVSEESATPEQDLSDVVAILGQVGKEARGFFVDLARAILKDWQKYQDQP